MWSVVTYQEVFLPATLHIFLRWPGLWRGNIHIMFCLSKLLTFFQSPFIICGGFNITDDAMDASPWLTEIGGAVWATTKPTCTAGQIGSVIDYAIISTGVARSIKGISVSQDLARHT